MFSDVDVARAGRAVAPVYGSSHFANETFISKNLLKVIEIVVCHSSLWRREQQNIDDYSVVQGSDMKSSRNVQ